MAVPMPELAGVEHRYAVVNGFRMHYAEAGSGDPLILQHGWPQHWWAWRHQIPILAERYRVIVPDLRGYGWSEAPPKGYEKAQFARDVVALMDALGIERARYAGHDWGAVAGYLLGIDHAERFERIACLGAPPPWRKGPPPPDVLVTVLAYQSVAAAPLLGAFAMRNGLPQFVLKAGRQLGEFSEEELRTYRAPLSEPGHDNAAVLTYRTFITKELPASLRGGDGTGRITVPTLVVIGAEEMFRKVLDPDLARSKADDIRFELVHGSGHWLMEEAPDAVNELLLEFLA
jgi:pimeloyl-ACP methyl ester carboxylesterase